MASRFIILSEAGSPLTFSKAESSPLLDLHQDLINSPQTCPTSSPALSVSSLNLNQSQVATPDSRVSSTPYSQSQLSMNMIDVTAKSNSKMLASVQSKLRKFNSSPSPVPNQAHLNTGPPSDQEYDALVELEEKLYKEKQLRYFYRILELERKKADRLRRSRKQMDKAANKSRMIVTP